MTYEESLQKLESIVNKMENGEFSVDELAQQLKEAQRLIKQCTDKLNKTSSEINKILEKS
ncbi:MAG: exodeoxyribonuclease VII small subunit [Prevotella sp.]|nr:exodeoxyribonuclease VII small subunit [Prevotella sp.]MDE7088702.1 exodeoxyribonuclease VII small subunit [Prevotella sp.]